jgi:hypothetical protein
MTMTLWRGGRSSKQSRRKRHRTCLMHTGALPPNIKPTKNRRVQKFKSDYAEFRKEFERIKEEVSQLVIANEGKKKELLSANLTACNGTTRRALLHKHRHAPHRRRPATLRFTTHCLIHFSTRWHIIDGRGAGKPLPWRDAGRKPGAVRAPRAQLPRRCRVTAGRFSRAGSRGAR